MKTLRLLTLVACLALTPALVACGGDGDDTKSARELLERTFRKEVGSADIALELKAELDGVEQLGDKPLRLALRGPYRSNGRDKLPSVDWKVRAEGAGQSFDAGLVIVPENVFVQYQDTTYEVGEGVISRFNRQLRQGAQRNLTLRDLGIDPAGWITDAELSDGETGGAATRDVKGKLDVEAVMKSFNNLFKSSAVREQLPLGAAPPRLSDEQIDDVENAVSDPGFEVSVGKEDEILRRLAFDVDFEIPEDQRDSIGGLEGGSLSFSLEQTNVGGAQRITPPSDARPLAELLRSLGIPPSLLLGAGSAVPEAQ